MAGLTSLESLNLANCHVNSAGIGALTGHGRTRPIVTGVLAERTGHYASTLAGHGPVPLGLGCGSACVWSDGSESVGYPARHCIQLAWQRPQVSSR